MSLLRMLSTCKTATAVVELFRSSAPLQRELIRALRPGLAAEFDAQELLEYRAQRQAEQHVGVTVPDSPSLYNNI